MDEIDHLRVSEDARWSFFLFPLRMCTMVSHDDVVALIVERHHLPPLELRLLRSERNGGMVEYERLYQWCPTCVCRQQARGQLNRGFSYPCSALRIWSLHN